MESKLNQLKETLGQAYDLSHAAGLLGWDQQTNMPSGGAEERGHQMATLARLEHQTWTAETTGRLLEDLERELLPGLDADSQDARLLRVARYGYDKRTRVPARLVADFTQLTTTASEEWVKARKASNFALFQPSLEKIFELRREYAACFAPYEHVYDPLLDDYERGMKTREVQAIFSALRPRQVDLIRAIAARPQVDNRFLRLNYPKQSQWDFGVEVITRFGYDWQRGRQDQAPHPFTEPIGIGDVRITTRFNPENLGTALFGTMHEAGHGMYEQGIDRGLQRSPLGEVGSLAVHESQSRMFENLIGRSLPFWRCFYPRLQAIYPTQLGNVDLDTFYKGINRVEPSFIRVEADEATYNLHIMLRLELEIALMEGSLAVKDLPEAWNTRMQEYLGVTPPNDAVGVLQDIHWSHGLIGYFPTYALGNLVSAQLWERMQHDLPDLEDQIEQGQFSGLLAWLREKIHRHGNQFTPQELVRNATGSSIDYQPYLRYLENKYSAIYGL